MIEFLLTCLLTISLFAGIFAASDLYDLIKYRFTGKKMSEDEYNICMRSIDIFVVSTVLLIKLYVVYLH